MFTANVLRRDLGFNPSMCVEQKLVIEVLLYHPFYFSPRKKLQISTLPGIKPKTAGGKAVTLPLWYSGGYFILLLYLLFYLL